MELNTLFGCSPNIEPCMKASIKSEPQKQQPLLLRCLHIHDFLSAEVWRSASSELFGTAMLAFLTGGVAVAFFARDNPESPFIIFCIMQAIIHSISILSAIPASEGHLNPMITITTMITGFTSPTKALLYITSQTIGSAAGAFALKSVCAEDLARKYYLGGCLLGQLSPVNGILRESGVSVQTGLVTEFVFGLCFLYLIYAMDIRDGKLKRVEGGVVSPVVIGVAVGLLLFISNGLLSVSGYTGPGLNPARCFGPAFVMGGHMWKDEWVFWIGSILSSLAFSFLYLSSKCCRRIFKESSDIITLAPPLL